MKLRLLPVILSLVVSTAVLFGGWFAYHSMAMENPLDNVIHQTDGVEQVQMDISNSEVSLQLKLKPDASLRRIVHDIRTNGASIIGKRSLNIQVTNEASPEIEQWWSNQLFAVAQAMETKQYSTIPQTLEAEASKLDGLQVFTEMDDENVYVRLVQGDHSKFVILPRTPERMGVWPNE